MSRPQTTRIPLPCFRPTGRRGFLLFRFLPTGVGIVFLHGCGESARLLAEVPLKYDSILTNDECHHARRSVFRWIRQESEPLGHLAVYDVVLRAAWATLSLTRQHTVIVAPVRSRSAVSPSGIALSHGCCDQGPDGALGFASSNSPIKAVVLPFITQDFLSVTGVLRSIEFLLCRHQFLANANGRYFIATNSPVQDFSLTLLGIEVP